MQYNSEISIGGTCSVAFPLRVIEVFTDGDITEKMFNKNNLYFENIFIYLIKHRYFEQLRTLIDAKVPPMLQSSSIAPTPISKCLLDMLLRPLQIVSYMDQRNEHYILILQEFCNNILSPKLSSSIKMFIIPALAEFPEFPFVQLINYINQSGIEPTFSLLFSILSLESKQASKYSNYFITIIVRFNKKYINYAFFINTVFSKFKTTPISYLQILASMSSTIIPAEIITDEHMEDMEDSDSEYNTNMLDLEDGDTLQECIDMLNEQQHVYRILQILDQGQDLTILQPLCELCHNLLIHNKLATHKYKLLYMLAFKPEFLKYLWIALLSVHQTSVFGGAAPLLQVISRGIPLSAEDSKKIVPLLDVFCSLFSLLIATLHDSEFFIQESNQISNDNTQQAMPFTTTELVTLSIHLKEVCLGLVELAFPDTRPTIGEDYKNALGSSCTTRTHLITHIRTHLFKVTVGLLRQLHTRDLRRPFCPQDHWITSNIVIPVDNPQDFTFRRHRLRGYIPFQGLRGLTREDLKEGPPLSAKEVRTLTLLREMPFVIPFGDRVVVFQSLIYHDKLEQQDEFTHFTQKPLIQITVRRDYLYEDAFEKLSPENEPELRLKTRVQFVNAAGLEESGVDGGGLFREFLSELLKTCFDPNRGFFKHTKDNMLYPNPTVHLLMDDFPQHYYFIGRILGKALYENLLVELPFAEFFLSKIIGLQSDVDAHHLASLDPIMYTNLLSLKSYKGDVTDLELDFTVLSDELGEKRIDELKPSGANIPVTNHNRIEYIHLMADYKLNKQIRAQCYAFKQGIGSVVPLEWLQMFNNKELQVLISGAQIPVDVNDLQLHTNYTGGYTPDHPTITAFWKVVNEFDDQQKSKLLKFVTSCSRPPLLGFKVLDYIYNYL